MAEWFQSVADFIESHGVWDAVWALIALVVSLVILMTIKKIFFGRVKHIRKRGGSRFAEALLLSLSGPATLAIISVATGIATGTLSKELRTHPIIIFIPKSILVIAGVWAVDRILVTFVQMGKVMSELSVAVKSLILTFSRLIILSLGALVVLDTLGISITPFLASLGVSSIAVALALQDTLGNLFSGIYLLVDHPVQIGDYVRLDSGAEGIVRRIGLRTTHIESLSSHTIIIPNSKLSSSQITNFNLPTPQISVSIDVAISYGNDLQKVETVSLEVARDVCGAAWQTEMPAPTVRFKSMGEKYIEMSVGIAAPGYRDQFRLRHELIKQLYKRFVAENIRVGGV